MTAEAVGPIIGADLLRQVVDAALGLCVCTGQCGRNHRKNWGRCLIEDSPAAPLHAVPREPCDPATELRLGPDGLMALCDDCHRRLLTRRARDARTAAAAALTASQEGLF